MVVIIEVRYFGYQRALNFRHRSLLSHRTTAGGAVSAASSDKPLSHCYHFLVRRVRR